MFDARHLVWEDAFLRMWVIYVEGLDATRYSVFFLGRDCYHDCTIVDHARAISVILDMLRRAWRGTLTPDAFNGNEYKHV